MEFKRNAGLAVLLLAIGVPAFAQEGTPDPRKPDMRIERRAAGRGELGSRMFSPEIALRMKSELKLSDAQVSQLEALRKEIVAERQERAREMIDIESRVAAGLISREDVRKQFENKRDGMKDKLKDRQDRLGKVLTPEQQEQLQRSMRHGAMHRMQGRRGGMRGPGWNGFGPGMMGPGRGWNEFGPGMMGPGFRGRRPMLQRDLWFDY